MSPDEPVLYDKDTRSHVARITFNRPERRNALTEEMYEAMAVALRDAEQDDSVKVVILRGSGGVFTTGQDMGVAYSWYETTPDPSRPRPRRPTQTRRLTYDRLAQRYYHDLYRSNKVLLAQVEGYALGGGLEFLLSCDLTVVAHRTRIGMPAARFMGPVLGNIHLFFHRLGPVLAKDLLLTGRMADASEAAERGLFNRFVPAADLEATAEDLAAMVARMPADGIAIAKAFYRQVEEQQGMAGSEITEIISHAFASNLSFQPDEYNFVRIRSQVGLKKAFELRDRYFDEGEPIGELNL
ncbi:MAG: enoyl-CoA hydratase/isomerase family protein [Acidimicrobiales bacterium]